MISIRRTKCPKILEGSPKKGKHFKNPSVVSALREMQHKKCCYCERDCYCEKDIKSEGELKSVEHFRPQSAKKYKEKRNNWNNLLLACTQCNRKKSDIFPTESDGTPLLIDPSDDKIDPEKHITFNTDDTHVEKYGIAKPRNESKLGEVTIDTVGLYLSFYVRQRRTFHGKLRAKHSDLLNAYADKDEDLLQTHKDTFKQYMSAKGKFSAYAREFSRKMRLDIKFQIKIPTGHEV